MRNAGADVAAIRLDDQPSVRIGPAAAWSHARRTLGRQKPRFFFFFCLSLEHG
jgi:hypothetical protein